MRSLASASRLTTISKGATIFLEGDRGSEVTFVVSGSVKLVKATPMRSVILRIVGAGGPIGLFAIFENRPFPATAIALRETTIVQVPEREFFAVVDRHPELVRQLLSLMMSRQAELTRRVVEMTGAVESRLALILLDLAEAPGPDSCAGLHVPLALSRQDLADLAGTTIETAIRIMSRWAKENVVETHPDGFTVVDPSLLRKLAGEA